MGGSPAARPISRCAIANLVRESIISSTSLPRSRKYSAMDVATDAHFTRNMAGWSEVATTSTERASPSFPRSFSMNSLPSRPLSPTSAITLRSDLTFFAIIPIRVLLPTPLPAKIPIL